MPGAPLPDVLPTVPAPPWAVLPETLTPLQESGVAMTYIAPPMLGPPLPPSPPTAYRPVPAADIGSAALGKVPGETAAGDSQTDGGEALRDGSADPRAGASQHIKAPAVSLATPAARASRAAVGTACNIATRAAVAPKA